MGYCINLEDSTMRFKKDNMFKAIKELITETLIGDKSFDWCTDNHLNDYFSKMDLKNITNRDIDNIWEDLRYGLTYSKDSEMFFIDDFYGEKLGDDFEIFSIVAPFAESGGFLEFRGEDGVSFRYIVKDKKIYEKIGKVIWE